MSDQAQQPALGLGPGPISPAMQTILDWDPSSSDWPGQAPSGEANEGDAATGGQPAAPAEGAGAAGAEPAAPAEGDGGQPAVPAEQPAADTEPQPGGQPEGEGTPGPSEQGADPTAYVTKFNEAATALENRTQEQMQKKAMDSLREEYPKYFELLTQGTQSARLLVGKRVPAASPDEPGQDAEGFVVLKDSADAKDWVEATKALIGAEAQTRAVKLMESEGPQMQVLHRTIDLFRNNPDIIPQTKGYNDALTRKFLAMAKPYEHRTEDGKLLGYTIDVQPLLSNLRSQAAEQPAAPAPVAPAAAAPAAPAQEPQSGIPSKAGAGADGESWDDFWTTMGIKPPMNL